MKRNTYIKPTIEVIMCNSEGLMDNLSTSLTDLGYGGDAGPRAGCDSKGHNGFHLYDDWDRWETAENDYPSGSLWD